MRRRISLLAGTLLLTGCATLPTPTSPSDPSTASIEAPDIVGWWQLVSVDGLPVPAGKAILIFEGDGSYRRQVSCNLVTGTYRITSGVLSLGALRETERGCDPYPNEALIQDALRFGPWTVQAQGDHTIILAGRRRLHLVRYTGSRSTWPNSQ
jgi:heat shock protein HslJ